MIRLAASAARSRLRSTREAGRRARTALCALLLLAAAAHAARAQERNPLELAVKAAFLAKFPLYVSWPEQAIPAPASPFNICVVDDDAFAALVERAAAGQTAAAHRIAVLRLAAPAAANHCQILYLADSDPRLSRREIAGVAGLPVLTVTDGIRDSAGKGMLNFVIADNRVRFEVDDVAARRSALSISSKLLSLALTVRSTP